MHPRLIDLDIVLKNEIELRTNRRPSIGALHSALTRLEKKGFVQSRLGGATSERGGRRKRIYEITAYGERVLKEARDFKMSLWNQFPGFAFRIA